MRACRPGSRSTPSRSRCPAIRTSASTWCSTSGPPAFFALGIAKATGRPVAVATTSGTAAAELLPAVVEASMSRATLVLLTADRPPELRGVGANQTIEQPGLFGRYVLRSIDAPVPGDTPDEETWHELVVTATRASMGLPPGPVHLNLPFREPLVGGPVSMPVSQPSGTEFTLSAVPEPEEFEVARARAQIDAPRAHHRGIDARVSAHAPRAGPPRRVAVARRAHIEPAASEGRSPPGNSSSRTNGS